MSSNENISPAVMRRVLIEISDLLANPPEDIKILPCEEDITDIQAIISGPQGTPYEGGHFRIKLKLGSEFPSAPPKGFFATKIFHPNISASGEICVNTLKRDWREDLGIKHLLLTIKCLLIVPNPESALNEEAGRMLLERYEDYARKAQLMTSIYARASPVVSAEAASESSDAPADSDASAALSSSSSDAPSAAAVKAKPAAPSADKRKIKRSLKRL